MDFVIGYISAHALAFVLGGLVAWVACMTLAVCLAVSKAEEALAAAKEKRQ